MSCEWIKIEDKLPEINQWVISYGSNGHNCPKYIAMTQFCYNANTGYYWNLLSSGCGCCDTDMKIVTHWMTEPNFPE